MPKKVSISLPVDQWEVVLQALQKYNYVSALDREPFKSKVQEVRALIAQKTGDTCGCHGTFGCANKR